MTLVGLAKIILTRAFIVYVLAACLVASVMNYDQLMRNAFAQTLSRLTPPINYFKEFEMPGVKYDEWKLEQCINYHDKISYFFPSQAAEAYGMLGYCHYRKGDIARSVKSYQSAIDENPMYFWPFYNLAVIAFNRGEYPKAYALFKRASQLESIKSEYFFSKSKVYSDVLLSDSKGNYDYHKSLTQGYQRAYQGMMLVHYKAKDFAKLLNMALEGLTYGLDDNGFYYYYAGVAAFNLGEIEKAVIFLQAAVKQDPQNADAYLYLGLCMQAGKNDDLAKDFIETAKRMHKQYGSKMEEREKFDIKFF